MQSNRNRQRLHNLSSELSDLKRTLKALSNCVGYLESSITSHCKRNDFESSSAKNTHFTLVYQSFLLIAKLLKHLLVLKSLIGIKGLTCCMNLSKTECGKNSVTRVIDGSKTETNCPVENFEQLELDLYPGMP